MAGVAANGRITLSHGLRHIAVVQCVAVAAVAGRHELAVPIGDSRKPDFKVDLRIASGLNNRLHAAEGRQVGQRWRADSVRLPAGVSVMDLTRTPSNLNPARPAALQILGPVTFAREVAFVSARPDARTIPNTSASARAPKCKSFFFI